MTPSRWRLIALDMDGTTLSHDLAISDENKKWIRKARESGIEVTFATGRHISGIVRKSIRDLELNAPAVTMNGSEVWTPQEQLLSRRSLTVDDIQWLLGVARQAGTKYWGDTVEGHFEELEFPNTLDDYTWLKFGFYSTDSTRIQQVWQTLEREERFELSNSHPLNVEVNPLGVTKATGLQTVCDYLNIDPSKVVVMGDSLNDVPMIKWAGLGVAMGNAQDTVKRVADFVTGRNDENGVAQAIERILNNDI
ncbi:Cof-type HAD-IIB family hydrolase [Alicyclobacillus dauci]|uniref:Cof-type HAD-IIB family hydrolase n=1 Tax=Alicyclobacillus dauci TaxID=1475485 RepID=A0ABY6Z0Y0_9BACL|nr:Cof-type HAD-IIB family hydrolase [Alicyclobacillus dauci]WAH35630.1 Cof-type HAD-IIB family hydrolase [Alicyclobacillus dauci]